MRVTQTMLTNSNLKYISQNYNRLNSIQDQLMSGKKITRPSQDPVVAMKGMQYRSQVIEVEQFQRNLNEGFNWMDNADSSLNQTGEVIQRIRELTVQASTDSNDATARSNIAKEITRLQEHIIALANEKVGDNYIFNGTNTAEKPINENLINIEFSQFTNATDHRDYAVSYQGQTFKFNKEEAANPLDPADFDKVIFTSATGDEMILNKTDGNVIFSYTEQLKYRDGENATVKQIIPDEKLVISRTGAVSTNTEDVMIEVMKGVTIPISVQPQGAFSIEMFSGLESIKKMLNDSTTQGADITKSLGSIDRMLNDIVATRAELGARTNRAEMVQNRLLEQEVIAKKTVSENEDIDFEQAMIDLTIQESLHRASLAVGARIIQPTLMDFLR